MAHNPYTIENNTPYNWKLIEGSLKLHDLHTTDVRNLTESVKAGGQLHFVIVASKISEYRGQVSYKADTGDVLSINFSLVPKEGASLSLEVESHNEVQAYYIVHGYRYNSSGPLNQQIDAWLIMPGNGPANSDLVLQRGQYNQDTNKYDKATVQDGTTASFNSNGEVEISFSAAIKELHKNEECQLIAIYYNKTDQEEITGINDGEVTPIHSKPVEENINDYMPLSTIEYVHGLDYSSWVSDGKVVFPRFCTIKFMELKCRFGGDTNSDISFRIVSKA